MVELKGSEKQVKWGNDIKREMLEALENAKSYKKYVNDFEFNEDEKKAERVIFEKIEELEKQINNETSAKWFIENRDITTRAFSKVNIKVFDFNELFEGFDYEEADVDDWDVDQVWDKYYTAVINEIENK